MASRDYQSNAAISGEQVGQTLLARVHRVLFVQAVASVLLFVSRTSPNGCGPCGHMAVRQSPSPLVEALTPSHCLVVCQHICWQGYTLPLHSILTKQ